jgi:hypothetical protein
MAPPAMTAAVRWASKSLAASASCAGVTDSSACASARPST